MSECLSNDDIKEICQNAFKYEYDVDTVGNLLSEIYRSHDKEIREKCIYNSYRGKGTKAINKIQRTA